MAPPGAPPTAMAKAKRVLQRPGNKSEEYKVAVVPSAANPADEVTSDHDGFKTDLQGIRTLVTCTICDQLLYEPWTLACGHTYCYSCLCSWFLPNKRKKTCPECRTVIKQMPAPAFLIKQMIEIFINRPELMPLDETADQHHERRQAESAIVEADKLCESGLFKGCFKKAIGLLQFNEEDQIYRCSVCSHEYLGGQTCSNCGVDLEGDELDVDIHGFSDADIEDSLDGFEFHDYQVDVDGETDEDDADQDDEEEEAQGPEFWEGRNWPLSIPSDPDEPIIRWGPSRTISLHDRRRRSRNTSSSENSEEEEDDEESESMRDFVIEDGEVDYEGRGLPRSPGSSSRVSTTSSRDPNDANDEDEYDGGGEVSNGRRRNHVQWATPSAITVTDSATTSDAGDLAEESRLLQESGWSPLEQEAESDFGEHQPFVTNAESENSDTDTTVGNQVSAEEDDDRHRENGSPAPTWDSYQSAAHYYHNRDRGKSVPSNTTEDNSETDPYDSDMQGTIVTDREGDVEMSVSPVSSRRSSITNSSTNCRPRRSVEIIGSANAIHEIADDSSEGTVQPATRRRRQIRYFHHSQAPEYDPRISMMFAQHQLDLRDATARQSPYFEPTSRSRTGASYRILPPRSSGPSNSFHSSSTVILTSVSNRPNRVQRSYPRRYFN